MRVDAEHPEGHPCCTERHPDTGTMCDLPMGHGDDHQRTLWAGEGVAERWSTPTGKAWTRAVEAAKKRGDMETYRRLIRAY